MEVQLGQGARHPAKHISPHRCQPFTRARWEGKSSPRWAPASSLRASPQTQAWCLLTRAWLGKRDVFAAVAAQPRGRRRY